MTKDEVIETKAAWGKTFVEIIDPTKENHVFRAYFEKPQREWVGLTDEEIYSLWEMAQIFSTPKHFYTLMEAKLKEKMCL
jgi:hypothetical protein